MSNRDLIVIGGSTGAIEPLRLLLSSLPADLPAAIAIVLHVPPRSTGIFTAIASSAGALPVRTATDGMRIETGVVHIAPPDRHLVLVDGHCRLGDGPRENLVRPAIDPLFRSAAVFSGTRAIGVILSGLLDDGADGLQAIKRCGGIALVQAPEHCAAPAMPLAALEATSVDLSADAAGVAAAMVRFAGEKAAERWPAPPDIVLELEIALGNRLGSDRLTALADPSPLSCPGCGGVLSQIRHSRPLRFRCQVGHGYTADSLDHEQEDQVDEAMRVALRIVEERATLVDRMGKEAVQVGRTGMADLYQERAIEYRRHAETLRKAVLGTLEREAAQAEREDAAPAEAIGAEAGRG